jgi:hypothetical protein
MWFTVVPWAAGSIASRASMTTRANGCARLLPYCRHFGHFHLESTFRNAGNSAKLGLSKRNNQSIGDLAAQFASIFEDAREREPKWLFVRISRPGVKFMHVLESKFLVLVLVAATPVALFAQYVAWLVVPLVVREVVPAVVRAIVGG